MPTSDIAIAAKNTATKGPSSFKSEYQTYYIKMSVNVFLSHSKLREILYWLRLQADVLCGSESWGGQVCPCIHTSTSASASACPCPVVMLHFGTPGNFSMIPVWVPVSTALLVTWWNCLFILCTKLIYSLSFNQNSSVTTWLSDGNF
jgi:hypothetical protein